MYACVHCLVICDSFGDLCLHVYIPVLEYMYMKTTGMYVWVRPPRNEQQSQRTQPTNTPPWAVCDHFEIRILNFDMKLTD